MATLSCRRGFGKRWPVAKVAFKQCDVERTVRALKAVGESVRGVEIRPDGSFRVLTGTDVEEKPLSPLEAWRRDHGHHAP